MGACVCVCVCVYACMCVCALFARLLHVDPMVWTSWQHQYFNYLLLLIKYYYHKYSQAVMTCVHWQQWKAWKLCWRMEVWEEELWRDGGMPEEWIKKGEKKKKKQWKASKVSASFRLHAVRWRQHVGHYCMRRAICFSSGPVDWSQACTRPGDDPPPTSRQGHHTQVHGSSRQPHDTETKTKVEL